MTSLRQRMLEDMQVRQLSPCTQRTYVETVARFARHFGRSPARLGLEEIRAYQVYLTNERRLASSSLVVAVSALRFLYRVTLHKRWVFDDVIPVPKKPRSLPVVLSPQEVVQFLDGVKAAKHHAILTTCYAAGLRISEAVRLTVSAIDSERMALRIAKGKGQKDRYVMLSPKLLEVLRAWWQVDRPRHWLFPGERPEKPITRNAVGRACHVAARRARLAKPVSPHALRHALRSISSRRAPTCVRFSSCSGITRPPVRWTSSRGRPSHLGPDARPSSASALRHPGWGAGERRQRLGCLPPRVLPAGPGPVTLLPSGPPRGAAGRLRVRTAALRRPATSPQ